MPRLIPTFVLLACVLTTNMQAYGVEYPSIAASKSFRVEPMGEGGAMCPPGRQVYSVIATAGPYNGAVPIVLIDDAQKPVAMDSFVFARGFRLAKKINASVMVILFCGP